MSLERTRRPPAVEIKHRASPTPSTPPPRINQVQQHLAAIQSKIHRVFTRAGQTANLTNAFDGLAPPQQLNQTAAADEGGSCTEFGPPTNLLPHYLPLAGHH